MSKANMELKSLRVKNSLSQQAIAELLGMTAASYNRKENGLRAFTVDEAGKIAELFGVTVEQIFFTNEVTKQITKLA